MRERRAVRDIWLMNFLVLFAKKYFSQLTPLVKYSTVVKAHFDVGCVKVLPKSTFYFLEMYFCGNSFTKKKYFSPSTPLEIQHSK